MAIIRDGPRARRKFASPSTDVTFLFVFIGRPKMVRPANAKQGYGCGREQVVKTRQILPTKLNKI
jgi:hypothetical protein